jgi:hypothetical protein
MGNRKKNHLDKHLNNFDSQTVKEKEETLVVELILISSIYAFVRLYSVSAIREGLKMEDKSFFQLNQHFS